MDNSPEWEQEMVVKAKEVLESDDYLPLPGKFDINEYHIMEDFCYGMNDDSIRIELLAGIKGRGTFRKFRDAIRRFGIQDQWYEFRDAEMKRIAIEWLVDNNIAYTKE